MIKGFREEWAFLSNFYPCAIDYEGARYASSEHAYQAAKFLDSDIKESIANLPTPGATKRMAKRLLDQGLVRKDWNDIKDDVMYDILTIKFKNPKLRKMLLQSGTRYLEETNMHGDDYWGVYNGQGQNKLGIILMKIRSQIQENYENTN